MVPPPQRRPSMGRQRIEIQRIEREEARQVCFSKRRAGLFKKASELAILCGAHVAVVVFSPAGKAFSFGHTSVEDVLDRFINPALPPQIVPAGAGIGGVPGTAGDKEPTPLSELNEKHGELLAQLDVQRARRESLEQRMAAARAENDKVSAWVDADMHQMTEGDLLAYGAALKGAYDTVRARANQVLLDARRSEQPDQGDPVAALFDGAGQFQGFVGDLSQIGDGGFEVGTAHGGDGMQRMRRRPTGEPGVPADGWIEESDQGVVV